MKSLAAVRAAANKNDLYRLASGLKAHLNYNYGLDMWSAISPHPEPLPAYVSSARITESKVDAFNAILKDVNTLRNVLFILMAIILIGTSSLAYFIKIQQVSYSLFSVVCLFSGALFGLVGGYWSALRTLKTTLLEYQAQYNSAVKTWPAAPQASADALAIYNLCVDKDYMSELEFTAIKQLEANASYS